jgi:hypothetical protein
MAGQLANGWPTGWLDGHLMTRIHFMVIATDPDESVEVTTLFISLEVVNLETVILLFSLAWSLVALWLMMKEMSLDSFH